VATYIRYATRAQKHVVKLDDARDRSQIAENITALKILDKSTGTFTITLIFVDETEMALTEADVTNGDVFRYDIKKLLLTHTAQAAVTIKLITEEQVL